MTMDSNIGRKDLDLQDDVGLKDRLLGITTEVGGGIATDWATTGLLAGGPAGWAAYGAINFGQGAYTNYLVQKHLYGEDNIKWGEVWASGGMGMIPFSQIPVGAKAAKYLGAAGSVKRGLVSGAGVGLAGEQLRVGIDEGRVLNPLEASVAAGVGGAFSGGLTHVSKKIDELKNPLKVYAAELDPTGATDDLMRQQAGLKMRLLNSIDPEGRSHPLEKELVVADPKNDLEGVRERMGSWMTVGRKPQPLNFLFGQHAGWSEGLLNLKSWRENPNFLKRGKEIAERWLTPPGKGVVFSTRADAENSVMNRIFGNNIRPLLGLPEDTKNLMQAHHITATKAVLTGQEGISYDSPYYHELQKVWEDLDLRLGNIEKNITGTVGHIKRDLESPHSIVHRFLDDVMGPDGTKFWTKEKLNQIVIYDKDGNAIGHKNFKKRVEWTKQQAQLFIEAFDLLKLAQENFYLAVKKRAWLAEAIEVTDEEMIDAFYNKLPPKHGTTDKIVDGKEIRYKTNVIEKIVREIAEERNPTPTIKSGSLKQLASEAVTDDVRNMIEKAEKIAVTSANGESMVWDLILNFPNLRPKAAIKKWTGNDPLMTTKESIQLEKDLEALIKSGAARHLKELYQRKQGELPAAVTKFDKGADD